MSENGEKRTRRDVSNFFKNPIVVFSGSFLFALLVVLFAERSLQVWGIIGVGFIYSLGSILYAIWNERVSSERLRRKYQELNRRVASLEAENKRLIEAKNTLEIQVPKVIAYGSVEKQIRILNENGDAHFSMTYNGINESGTPLQKVRFVVNTKGKITRNKVGGCKFNHEDVYPHIRNVPFGNGWRNEIILETSEPTDDGGPITAHYEVQLDKEYAEGFREGEITESNHEVSLKTDKFSVEVIAPKGFYFTNPTFNVKDVFGNIEIPLEKDRIMRECPPLPKEGRRKILWVIKNPRLSYRYFLLFAMKRK